MLSSAPREGGGRGGGEPVPLGTSLVFDVVVNSCLQGFQWRKCTAPCITQLHRSLARLLPREDQRLQTPTRSTDTRSHRDALQKIKEEERNSFRKRDGMNSRTLQDPHFEISHIDFSRLCAFEDLVGCISPHGQSTTVWSCSPNVQHSAPIELIARRGLNLPDRVNPQNSKNNRWF